MSDNEVVPSDEGSPEEAPAVPEVPEPPAPPPVPEAGPLEGNPKGPKGDLELTEEEVEDGWYLSHEVRGGKNIIVKRQWA